MQKALPVYTFVHIPKCGGSCVEVFFEKHYSDRIFGTTHKWTCQKDNHPIVIVREPIERFISCYHYWKNGSHGRNARDQQFHQKYDSFTIKDFIQLIKNGSQKELVIGFMWRVHYEPQVNWMKEDVYEHSIVITYESDLNPKIQALLEYLEIENKKIPLGKSNVTRKKEGEEVVLDEEDILFIKEKYAADFVLWEKIKNQPELFKKVL